LVKWCDVLRKEWWGTDFKNEFMMDKKRLSTEDSL